VALCSVLLVLCAVVYHRLTGRRYPQAASGPAEVAPAARHGFAKADIDAVLASYNQVLDVSRSDLEALLGQAQAHAYARRLGQTLCSDVMSKDVIAVQFGDSLAGAWALMRDRRIKALPVVDRVRRIVGIITTSDFMRHAGLDAHDGLGQRLRDFVRPSGQVSSSKPEVVGQIMTRKVRVASASRPLADLLPLFSEHGHHHLPIVDDDKRLVGILTQTDVVRALARAEEPEATT
jgi:CBS domain-containing membrane protein